MTNKRSSRRKSARVAQAQANKSAIAAAKDSPHRNPLQILPPAPKGVHRDADLIHQQLVGREIIICWEDDNWYDAIVVRYYPKVNEYKLVYRADDGIEVINLHHRRWVIAPKKAELRNRKVLDGAIVEFTYPGDGKLYKAMIYENSFEGDRIKIAYLDEHSTDTLKGGGWEFITQSPCRLQDNEDSTEIYLREANLAMKAVAALSKSKGSSSLSGRVEKSSRR